MYGDMLDPVRSEIERLGCVAVNRKSNQVKVVIREHHGRRADAVRNVIAVGSVIVNADLAFLADVVDELP